MNSASHPALAVSGLSKRYGPVLALDALAFAVANGSFTALLGPNGAGKTSLFQILTGLFVADGGTARVMGIDIARRPVAALARLGIVFQQSALDLDLSARQNLVFHGGLHGLARADAKSRAAHWLGRFGLADSADKPARHLSGGTRRKVELARALMTDPELLLLDEPTQGLDPQSRRDLVDTVFALVRERNLAALWATHIVGEVEVADDIIVLDKGRIVGRGDPAALIGAAGVASLEQAFFKLTGPPRREEGS
jgi:ABC-2 type transport system ATP-binding protein